MTGSIKIKVVIENGLVRGVVCDDIRLPIDVEIVEIREEYDDYEELKTYRDSLCHNGYNDIDYTFAKFNEN